MPLRRLTYRSLEELLASELIRDEHGPTAALIDSLHGVLRRGTFTRDEFRAMCRWKSPRARRFWETNSTARIRAVSRAVLATRDERVRMELLTSLAGVGVPMGSAILTLLDPHRYGVLDIRAWQVLFAIRSVDANRRGQGFTIAQWLDFLTALRTHARRLGVRARTVEYTLFHCHRKFQRGTLYVSPAAPRTARRPPDGGRARARPSRSGDGRRPRGAGRG